MTIAILDYENCKVHFCKVDQDIDVDQYIIDKFGLHEDECYWMSSVKDDRPMSVEFHTDVNINEITI